MANNKRFSSHDLLFYTNSNNKKILIKNLSIKYFFYFRKISEQIKKFF